MVSQSSSYGVVYLETTNLMPRGFTSYCDNEPWGGRNSGSTEPNHNTEVLYCGKYENDTGMWCDYIKLHPEYNGAAIEYHFWLGESSF